ncbi:MAG TPA: SRPBCC domain-containing protein [Pyrinomonadaceae bacterium]|nr:SRPBCC domain-containing protein [Pyrinomonadaceae bacterium]
MISEEKLTLGPEAATKGAVVVTVQVSASPDKVWQSLTSANGIAQWFGELNCDLKSGGRARVDFGDGDFFDLDSIVLSPPNLINYDWRFLGIGPRDSITWKIEPNASGCLVTVEDVQPERTAEAALSLREGWLDFTHRLVEFHLTGQNMRYDWRRDLDVGLPISGSAEQVWIALFTPEAQKKWLPFKSPIEPDTCASVADNATPEKISFAKVNWQPLRQVEFQVSSDTWKKPTTCRIELTARNDDTLVYVSHNGWEGISDDPREQLEQRKRFCALWIESLKQAARLGEAGVMRQAL